MYTHIKSVQILISLMKQHNIRHIVISPGTRNTALVGSIENDDFFTCYSIVDERSAAFFALGISEALDVPVCVSCTAATATCNYLPAIKEAYERNIQLVALTADQNPYEMFHMEDQCINQVDMFHGFVKYAVDIPMVKNDVDYWYCNRCINEAFLELNHNSKGPIQINYHMSYGLDEISTYDVAELPVTRKIERYSDNFDLNAIAQFLKSKQRILVVCGSDFDLSGSLREQLIEFFYKFNVVIIADTYANVYDKDGKILNPKALGDCITQEQVKYLQPDIIITFGSVYYSTVKYFMSRYSTQVEHWQIAVDGKVNDGYHCLTRIYECRPEKFFAGVNQANFDGQNNNIYFDKWDRRLKMMHFSKSNFTNMTAIKTFCESIPENSLLHTTVLDSIRMSNYIDFNHNVKCFANIGADGIDGALSTFLGQTQSEENLTYLLIGDLCLLYDMNALLQTISSNVRIVVINNYAGAEFHKNFGLKRIPTLNKHIAAGHNVRIENCCIVHQFKYLSATTADELELALTQLHSESEQPILLEIFTDADADAKALKDYWNSNRQEIPGVKIGLKSRIKQLIRNLLGNNISILTKFIRK